MGKSAGASRLETMGIHVTFNCNCQKMGGMLTCSQEEEVLDNSLDLAIQRKRKYGFGVPGFFCTQKEAIDVGDVIAGDVDNVENAQPVLRKCKLCPELLALVGIQVHTCSGKIKRVI